MAAGAVPQPLPVSQPLPLEGLRVLDVTHIVAGPFCSMILADMGAEVIKIERPGSGERGRGNGPFIEGPDGQRVSARYLGLNRNKKSVSLDLPATATPTDRLRGPTPIGLPTTPAFKAWADGWP